MKQLSRKELAQMVIEAEERIEQMQPAYDYAQRLLGSDELYTASAIAKSVNISSGQKLNTILHDLEIQYYDGFQKHWLPYAPHSNKGYCKVVTHTNKGFTFKNLEWTDKGRQFILDVLTKEGII
jgi:phage antirepressor YoqD-like protein